VERRMSDSRAAAAHGRVLWGAGTPRTLRAHWMLRELDLPYEHRPITSRSGETHTPGYVRLNPSRKIPTLEDGDFVVSESAAIVSYLAETYGAAKGLMLPPGPRDRTRYYQWCFFIMMELDANTLYIIRRHEDLKDVYGEAPNALATARRCFQEQAEAAAQRLGSAGGPYALGERFTPVDILLTTCLTGAVRREIALPQSLRDYMKLTTTRPAYKRALDANQPPKR
jgi:glutathione S-transferase